MAQPGTTAPEQTTTEAPDGGRAYGDSRGSSPRPVWPVRVPAAVRDVVLVVLGALLALAGDYREALDALDAAGARRQ